MVRAVKYKDLKRFLERSDWHELRTSGSHVLWEGPNG